MNTYIWIAAIGALGAGITAILVVIRYHRLHPPHKHDPECLRVSHYNITQTDDVIVKPGGPWTRIMWKCRECGEKWTTEKIGTWEKSDFS